MFFNFSAMKKLPDIVLYNSADDYIDGYMQSKGKHFLFIFSNYR